MLGLRGSCLCPHTLSVLLNCPLPVRRLDVSECGLTVETLLGVCTVGEFVTEDVQEGVQPRDTRATDRHPLRPRFPASIRVLKMRQNFLFAGLNASSPVTTLYTTLVEYCKSQNEISSLPVSLRCYAQSVRCWAQFLQRVINGLTSLEELDLSYCASTPYETAVLCAGVSSAFSVEAGRAQCGST